ncbi:MAG TPA: CCA tRNA nucleotidyltransferase [Acetobacteraceae bacterium]|nr:CCA tRNA nucleotidyltransferase [Acetobacteraceae bacterium]
MAPPHRPVRIDPAALLARPGLAAVLAALPGARLVGGAVRDALAHRPVADIDLATPDPPERVVQRLAAAGLRAIPTGLGHGTITALADGAGYEITTLRQDVETDGRHARVAFTDDWRIDATRRDFTINAMSMAADGAVFDYFTGIADLAAGRVRFVGDPAARIAEDYLRILRFFRFQARYGAGEPDPAATAAIAASVYGLALLSPERVWSELKRILAAPDPLASVALMDRLGVLAAVLPEGADPAALGRLAAMGAPADPLLRLAALLTGDAAGLAERLRLSAEERDRLAALRIGPVPDPSADDGALRRALAETPAGTLIGRAFLRGAPGAEWAGLRARLAGTPRPVFPLAGRDALALGIAPGPRVGALLRAVQAWWMAGGCVAGGGECRAELARRAQG